MCLARDNNEKEKIIQRIMQGIIDRTEGNEQLHNLIITLGDTEVNKSDYQPIRES